jgi:hypothetical protein
VACNAIFKHQQELFTGVPGQYLVKGEFAKALLPELKRSFETNEQLKDQVGGSHYRDMEIQPIEYILKNKIGFSEGNVIKYVSRWRSKGGIQDLEKAVQTLQQLITHEKEKNDEALRQL